MSGHRNLEINLSSRFCPFSGYIYILCLSGCLSTFFCDLVWPQERFMNERLFTNLSLTKFELKKKMDAKRLKSIVPKILYRANFPDCIYVVNPRRPPPLSFFRKLRTGWCIDKAHIFFTNWTKWNRINENF